MSDVEKNILDGIDLGPRIVVAIRGDVRGKYYIARTIDGETCEYLHSDGEWRTTATHEGKYTGYYASHEEAAEVLKRYCPETT